MCHCPVTQSNKEFNYSLVLIRHTPVLFLKNVWHLRSRYCVSDLKARQDYCENLNFCCPVQTEPFDDWEARVESTWEYSYLFSIHVGLNKLVGRFFSYITWKIVGRMDFILENGSYLFTRKVRVIGLFWDIAWFFSEACHYSLKTKRGGKIQMFTTSCRIFTLIRPRLLDP